MLKRRRHSSLLLASASLALVASLAIPSQAAISSPVEQTDLDFLEAAESRYREIVPTFTPNDSTITAATTPLLARTLAEESHDSGDAIIIAGSAEGLQLAAPAAAWTRGSVLLSDSIGTELNFLEELNDTTAPVYLVGPAVDFPDGYASSHSQYIESLTDLTADSLFEASARSADAFWGGLGATIVASDAASSTEASEYASSYFSPLLLLDDADITAVQDYGSTNDFANLVWFTGETPSSEASALIASREETASVVSGANLALDSDPEIVATAAVTQGGGDASTVVAAPVDQVESRLLAASYAAVQNISFRKAGPANNFASNSSDAAATAKAWASDYNSTLAVGTGLPTNAAELITDYSAVTAPPAPSMRVTNVDRHGTHGAELTVSTPATSTILEAYDALGVKLADGAVSSGAASITLVEDQNVALVSLDASGAIVDQVDYKTNGWQLADGTDHKAGQSIFATITDDVIEVSLKDGPSTPRVISLTSQDPTGIEDDETAISRITCDRATTIAIPDPSKEWRVLLSAFTSGNHPVCDSSVEYDYGISNTEAGITAPPSVLPVQQAAIIEGFRSATNSANGTGRSRQGAVAASPSQFEIEAMKASVSKPSLAASHQQFLFRYEAFIAEPYVDTPRVPQGWDTWLFAGDNRTAYESGTSRHWMVARFYFGGSNAPPTPSIVSKGTGITSRWTCWSGSGTCGDLQTAQAPTNGLKIETWLTSASRVPFNLVAASSNPLFPASPPIRAHAFVDVRWGRSIVGGSHVRMPTHALMWGVPESEYKMIYVSRTTNKWCLSGRIIPGCTVSFSVQL